AVTDVRQVAGLAAAVTDSLGPVDVLVLNGHRPAHPRRRRAQPRQLNAGVGTRPGSAARDAEMQLRALDLFTPERAPLGSGATDGDECLYRVLGEELGDDQSAHLGFC